MPSRLIPPALAIALLLILHPIADLATNVYPFQPTSIQWRFGTVGLTSGFLLTPLLGLGLGIWVAIVAGFRRTRVALASIGIFAGVVLLGATALFFLDALQIRIGLPDAARDGFGVGSAKVLLKNGSASVVLLWLSVVALRSPGEKAVRTAPTRQSSRILLNRTD